VGKSGFLERSTNKGTNWYDIASVSSTSALLLSPDTRVRFVPVANYNGTPPVLEVRAIDDHYSGTLTSNSSRFAIDTTTNGGSTNISGNLANIGTQITQVNDIPAISGIANTTTNDKTSIVPLSAITLTDIDAGEVLQVTVKIDNPIKGVLNNLSGFTNNGDGTYTLTGTPANVTTAIRALTFKPTENRILRGQTEQTTFTVTVKDSAGTTAFANSIVTVSPVNDAPNKINLSNTNLLENAKSGLVIGQLTTQDVDPGDTHTYKVVNAGAPFVIKNHNIRAAASFDHELKEFYTVRIESNDGGLTYEEEFTINILDVNEAPTDIYLDKNTVNENLNAGTLVGNMTTEDEDEGESHTYKFVDNATYLDNQFFVIENGNLKTAQAFDFETKTSYTVKVETNDGELTYQKEFNIQVNNVNEGPSNIALDNNQIQENLAPGVVVGNLTTKDIDVGDTHTYKLVNSVGYPDNAAFIIDNGKLKTAQSFNFKIKNTTLLMLNQMMVKVEF